MLQFFLILILEWSRRHAHDLYRLYFSILNLFGDHKETVRVTIITDTLTTVSNLLFLLCKRGVRISPFVFFNKNLVFLYPLGKSLVLILWYHFSVFDFLKLQKLLADHEASFVLLASVSVRRGIVISFLIRQFVLESELSFYGSVVLVKCSYAFVHFCCEGGQRVKV